MASIEIGYNRRHWVKFNIADATPEEIALLQEHHHGDYNESVFEMLLAMEDAGRLTVLRDESDDTPEYFNEHVDPNILVVWEDGE